MQNMVFNYVFITFIFLYILRPVRSPFLELILYEVVHHGCSSRLPCVLVDTRTGVLSRDLRVLRGAVRNMAHDRVFGWKIKNGCMGSVGI